MAPGAEVSRVERLVAEAGHTFTSFSEPSPCPLPPPPATGQPPWPCSSVVHAAWVLPDQLRLCIQLFRLANRMWTAYDNNVLMLPWLSAVTAVISRLSAHPPALEVYHQVFKLAVILTRSDNDKLAGYVGGTLALADFLTSHLVSQAVVTELHREPRNGEEEGKEGRPAKQARVEAGAGAVRVFRVPRASLWLRGALTNIFSALREIITVRFVVDCVSCSCVCVGGGGEGACINGCHCVPAPAFLGSCAPVSVICVCICACLVCPPDVPEE